MRMLIFKMIMFDFIWLHFIYKQSLYIIPIRFKNLSQAVNYFLWDYFIVSKTLHSESNLHPNNQGTHLTSDWKSEVKHDFWHCLWVLGFFVIGYVKNNLYEFIKKICYVLYAKYIYGILSAQVVNGSLNMFLNAMSSQKTEVKMVVLEPSLYSIISQKE